MGASGSSPRAAVEGTLEVALRCRLLPCPCPCLGAPRDGSPVAPGRAGPEADGPAFPPPGLLPRGGRGLEAVAAAGAEHHGHAVSVPREGRGQPRAGPAPGHDAAGVGRHAAGHPRGPAVRSAARPREAAPAAAEPRLLGALSTNAAELCRPQSRQSHGLNVLTWKRPPPGRHLGAWQDGSAGSDLGGHEARGPGHRGWEAGPRGALLPAPGPSAHLACLARTLARLHGGSCSPSSPAPGPEALGGDGRLVRSLTALGRAGRCPGAHVGAHLLKASQHPCGHLGLIWVCYD